VNVVGLQSSVTAQPSAMREIEEERAAAAMKGGSHG
jgi:hypothetical protein